MTFKIESIYDIGRYYGWKEGKQAAEQAAEQRGEQRGDQKRLRDMLEQCVSLRFPRITHTALNGILTIDDSTVLESIFKIACTADSLDVFQRDIQGIVSTNRLIKNES